MSASCSWSCSSQRFPRRTIRSAPSTTSTSPITLTGVVTNIEWTNPHSHFYLDVKDAHGKVVNWKFEGYPPGVLYRTGWKRDTTMKPGDTITVFGWRARDGGNWAHSREITVSGRQEAVLRAAGRHRRRRQHARRWR